MTKFLKELESKAVSKEFSIMHGSRPIVIVVDEANALKKMANKAVRLN
jgi:hypothetical protein